MYITSRHIESRSVRVFHPAQGNPDSFHLISTDLSVMTENHDALMVYMAVLWNKEHEIKWKNPRFNRAIEWLVDRGVMHKVTGERYTRSEVQDGSPA